MRKQITSILNGNKQKILDILFLLAVVSLLRKLFFSFAGHDYVLKDFVFSEFLINYHGGFVRRGLLGHFLHLFLSYTHLDFMWVTKILSLSLFLFLCIYFIRMFIKRGYPLYLLATTFFIGALPQMDWYRKDSLLLLSFAALCYLLKRYWRFWIVKALVVNIILVLAILTHEVFAFFSLPLVLCLFKEDFFAKKGKKGWWYSFLALLPATLTFIYASLCRGNEASAQLIINSWQPLIADLGTSPDFGIFKFFKMSLSEILNHNISNYLFLDAPVFPLLMYCLLFPLIYYLLVNTPYVFVRKPENYTSLHRRALSALVVFQFVCMLPVFIILSYDWGRLWLYISASSFIFLMSFPPDTILQRLPQLFVRCADKINSVFDSLLPPSKSVTGFSLLFVGIPAYTYQSMNYMEYTAVYHVFYIISFPFRYLLGYV